MGRKPESKTKLSSFELGDMILTYWLGEKSHLAGLSLVPRDLAGLTCSKPCRIEPLIQLKLARDDYAGDFSQGRTLRGSESTQKMLYKSQRVFRESTRTCIETRMEDERGFACTHRLYHTENTGFVTVSTSFENGSDQPATLEMLSSFTLGMLSPFALDEGVGTLEWWHMRSAWSSEGRLVHESAEHAHMEPSWQHTGSMSTRWGQVGSMPVRDYFPFTAVEDKTFGVIWAAELTGASSWQLEAGRVDNGFFLSGGLADREFGQWTKTLAPSETFTAPDAILTVTTGGIEDVCERLTGYTEERLDVPKSEETLPVLFNEFCTTWGCPSEENIRAAAEKLRGLGLDYFVIDAGWYAETPGSWSRCAGSWNVSPFLFPNGLDHTLDIIRENGMQPGIWFELEVVGRDAVCFNRADWMLRRDGVPITVGDRRFWDLRLPEVKAYLHERVIDFLRVHRFKYIKIDYNETLGIGPDDAESPGEGLRQQIEAVQDFFRQIHKELPDVVIEVCSSGGHRLVPSFLSLASMASFSDAHECLEIPIIAANMHRMILPRQSQIWAVLHAQQDEAALYYKLTAGLLGRLCLSGEIGAFSQGQWDIVRRVLAFYRGAAPIIRSGKSRRYGKISESWRHPEGWQTVVRTGETEALAVIHTFDRSPETVRFPIPAGYTVSESCMRSGIRFAQTENTLIVTGLKAFDGLAFRLTDRG